MKKTFLSNYAWAALAITAATFSACSSDSELIDIAEPINKYTVSGQESGQYTMTVKVTKSQDGASTRALSLEGKTLNATWKEGETVEVYSLSDDEKTVFNHLGQLTAAASDNGATTLTGAVYAPSDTKKVKLFYPGFSRDYMRQDGTLETLATSYDYAEASITSGLSVDTENYTISCNGTVNFESQQAIVKFTLLNKESNTPINANSLTVAGETGTLLKVKDLRFNTTNEYGPLTANLNEPSGEVFIALAPVSSRIMLTARDGSSFYTYSTTQEITFEKGKYYSITAKMEKSDAIDISTLTMDYEAQDGDILTGTMTPDNYHISIADGATVTLLDANIQDYSDFQFSSPAGITCLGDANLILKGTNIVNAASNYYPNIYIKKNYTLTIDGEGSLSVGGNHNGCGIGGGNAYESRNGGSVTVNGGQITVTNGIGSGSGGSIENIIITGGELNVSRGIGNVRNGTCGTISIHGGTVIATGENAGAAIGSGELGSCKLIFINGGNVTATGASFGGSDGTAAIGCGAGGSCNGIQIEGGTINAQGGNGAAGIGTGVAYNGQGSTCNGIYILSNCNITATGGVYGAGIGSSGELSSCGDINIAVGDITATGGLSAAGIGSGWKGQCGNINISGKYDEWTLITATGGMYGAGIGSGREGLCGNIEMSGGSVEYPGAVYVSAIGNNNAAGIGTSNYKSTCGDITITSTVTMITAIKQDYSGYASYSVGIGHENAENTCGTIAIGGIVQDGSISDEKFIYQP